MPSSPHASEAVLSPAAEALDSEALAPGQISPMQPYLTLSTVAKHAALPVAIGAGVAAAAYAVIWLRSTPARPRFVLSPVPKSQPGVVGGVAKAALVALLGSVWKTVIAPHHPRNVPVNT